MDARFPFSKLPEKARQRVVQVMDIREIFGFSLIFKKCKDLTISSKIESRSLSVSIGNKINISFWTIRGFINLYFYTEPHLRWITDTDGQKKTLKPPESVVANVFHLIRDGLKWENSKDFGMEEWLNHIKTVFDCRQIDSVRFQRNAFCFNIDYIKETFGNTDRITVDHSGSFDYNESILKKFLTIEKLSIEANAFPNFKIPTRILIQNFASLKINYQKVGLKCISLDDLLMINSEYIYITTYQAPLKLLNKFVKLWKQGASPRMTSFQIIYHNGSVTDVDEILNEIKCDEIRQERHEMMLVNKIFETYTVDGTKATIRFDVSSLLEDMILFELFL